MPLTPHIRPVPVWSGGGATILAGGTPIASPLAAGLTGVPYCEQTHTCQNITEGIMKVNSEWPCSDVSKDSPLYLANPKFNGFLATFFLSKLTQFVLF